MKKYLLVLITFLISNLLMAQTPLNDEIVKMNSVSTADMNAIIAPFEGSVVFNTTEATLYQFDGTNWIPLQSVDVVSDDANNQVEEGTDGGAYLGPTVYTGFFIIDNTTLTATGTYAQSITGLPFEPSQITFAAHPNIGEFNIDGANATGNNNVGTLENTFGTMNGFARQDAASINQAVIFSGGSGSSINNISRYANNSQCVGVRYTDNDGESNGKITASLTSFIASGFSLNVTYTLGTQGNANQRDDVLDQKLIVLYTAYK